MLLHEARRKLAVGNAPTCANLSSSTGCLGRPSITIPRVQLELYLECGFSVTKLAQLSVCHVRLFIAG